MPNPSTVRNVLRQRMIKLRAEIPSEERSKANNAVHKSVFHHWTDEWKSALVYVNRADEVATIPILLELLQRKIRLCVPAFDPSLKRYYPSELHDFETELESGRFGILEPKQTACRPVSAQEMDVILLPGVAFDRFGNRLGYGYGHFDRICHAVKAVKIGLAYQFQIVDTISSNANDVPMNMIITDREVIACPRE